MKTYNPNIHNRRSIRLKGYDYSKAGLYFITMCIQHRARLFGYIIDGNMVLNDAGRMIEKWYKEIECKFPNIKCHAMVVMPEHFHCILEITTPPPYVRADLRVSPDSSVNPTPLSRVIQWFKTMTTNEYIRGVKTKNWQQFEGRFWQRNYWEHIIRNEKAYHNISRYIINNPPKWWQDHKG